MSTTNNRQNGGSGSNNENPTENHPLLPNFLPQTIHPDGESNRSGFQPSHFFRVLWRSSNTVSMRVNFLWPFALLAIIMDFATPHLDLWIFAVSYIAMVPAANLLGFAGQEFARKMPKVSGILIETTFGSIVEILLFLILIIKHKAGSGEGAAEHGNLIPIIQAAILGSILTNLLLCLGLCFIVGGLRLQVQKFHAAVSEVGNGLLLVAGFGLVIPSAFYSALKGSTTPDSEPHGHHNFTDRKLQHDILGISRATSILLISAFIMFDTPQKTLNNMLTFFRYIWYNARTNHSIFDEVLEQDEHHDLDHHADIAKPKFTMTECVIAITGSVSLVTVLAVFLVNRIENVVVAGIPDQFLGLILLPLVEKAAEHLTAIDEAWDGQMVCTAPTNFLLAEVFVLT
jgi:Ca2+:H+ antiporter